MKTTQLLKSVAVATALVGASLSASAAATNVLVSATLKNLGPIVAGAAPTTFFGSSVPGGFFDTFTFTLPANSGSGYSVGNTPFTLGTYTGNVALATFSLWSSNDGVLFNTEDNLVKQVTVVGGESTSFSVAAVPAGSYFLTVWGVANGSIGGSYGGAISVTPFTAPVPEPETFAMLLAGLGVMGAIARRRKV